MKLYMKITALFLFTTILVATQAIAAQEDWAEVKAEKTLDTADCKEKYLMYQEMDKKIAELYLYDEEQIQYFAYLDLTMVEDTLKPVVLAARNRIICRYSWTADGVDVKFLNGEGKTVEVLPQFSELFPEDWDEPIFPVVVDLTYYK